MIKPYGSELDELSSCSICNSTTARVLYTAVDRLSNSGERFTIVECEGCGVLRTAPDMSYAELARFYPEDYWGDSAEPSDTWIRRSQREKLEFLGRCGLTGGRILDVGCGAGFFLRALESDRWERFGVETGDKAATIARRFLGDKIVQGTFSAAQFQRESFDVVSFWSALEHTNEPRENLISAAELLRPGGTLIVQLPNATSYQARAFGGDWFSLDAPRHRYHYSPSALERLLKETGFSVYRTSYFSRAHNAHALRQSLKKRLLSAGAGARVVFYLSIPFIRPFDSLMSALGKGATMTVGARKF